MVYNEYVMKIRTIEDMQKIAASREGVCLSREYINCKTKLQWRCSKLHQWFSSPDNITQGKWCPQCANINNGNRCRKYSIHDAQKLAIKRNGTCLSSNYQNWDGILKWECSNKHIWRASFGNVRRGSWCPYCCRYITENKCRYIIENLTGLSFRKNHMVLSKYELDGYNGHLNMAFEYNGEQHYRHIKRFHRTYIDFLDQQQRDTAKLQMCKLKGIHILVIPYWASQHGDNYLIQYINKRLPNSNNKPYIDMKEFYSSCSELKELIKIAKYRGGEILSSEYHNQDTILKCQCNNNHIWSTAASNIKSSRWCPHCAKNTKYSLLDMYALAHQKGGKCLSTEYEGSHTKLLWECKRNHTWRATPSSVRNCRKGGSWCPICFNLKRSGKN